MSGSIWQVQLENSNGTELGGDESGDEEMLVLLLLLLGAGVDAAGGDELETGTGEVIVDEGEATEEVVGEARGASGDSAAAGAAVDDVAEGELAEGEGIVAGAGVAGGMGLSTGGCGWRASFNFFGRCRTHTWISFLCGRQANTQPHTRS